MDKPIDANKTDPAVGYTLLANPPEQGRETPEQRRKRLFWDCMFGYRLAWQAGDSLAIARAVRVCQICHEPPPCWLTSATLELVDRRMSSVERRQQSALMVHMMRWRAVIGLRDPKRWLYDHGKVAGRCETLLAGAPQLLWKDCWPGAAEILDGTEAAGSNETIRASYIIIQSAGGEHTTLESYRHVLQRRDQRNSNK
jgi:hypothetical protein